MRLDRLGDGHESAKSAVETAKAVVDEVGARNVHRVTRQVATLKKGNEHRDLFRFIRLPLDISWVTCPVYETPGSDKVIDGKLPMYDPHELLQYLWTTGRLRVDASTIRTSSCTTSIIILIFASPNPQLQFQCLETILYDQSCSYVLLRFWG